MNIIGETERSIDDKGRIVVPTEIREDLGELCYLTRGFDRCLNLYAKKEYDELLLKLKDPTKMDRKAVMLQRRYAVSPVSVDNQGRLPISAALREYAGISLEQKSDQKSVVLFSADDKIEIWAKDRWVAYNSEITDDDVCEAFEAVMSRNASKNQA